MTKFRKSTIKRNKPNGNRILSLIRKNGNVPLQTITELIALSDKINEENIQAARQLCEMQEL